jgi:hydroxyacylglutathione hydrolase
MSFHYPHQGDSLFIGGCGRTFEGDPERLYATMDRFRQLPEETLVFCGEKGGALNTGMAPSAI